MGDLEKASPGEKGCPLLSFSNGQIFRLLKEKPGFWIFYVITWHSIKISKPSKTCVWAIAGPPCAASDLNDLCVSSCITHCPNTVPVTQQMSS